MTGRNRGISVIAGGRLVTLGRCEICGAVLTPEPGMSLADVIELHSLWHRATTASTEEIRAELRREGFRL
jgi:hypothetical protein